jgi:hypothetical protein
MENLYILAFEKWRIFFGRVVQATPACLMAMVSGNMLALTINHWIVALKTGALTGLIAIGVSFAFKDKDWHENKFVLAAITALCTAVADRVVHPTHFGGDLTEALVTGMAAGLLCLAIAHTKLDKALR